MILKVKKPFVSKRPSSPKVFIDGPLKLQNELIAWFFQYTSGLSCIDLNNSELDKLLNKRQGKECLILLDCQGGSPAGMWPKIRDISDADSNRFMAALFNTVTWIYDAGHKKEKNHCPLL